MTNPSDPTERLDFDSFCRSHADWLEQIPPGPLYCLTEKMITRLGSPRLGMSQLLDGSSVRGERDLLALCIALQAIGINERRPIVYSSLTQLGSSPKPTLPDLDHFLELGWSPENLKETKSLLGQPERPNLRLAGYVGWLWTEPPFLAAVQKLADRWRRLPDHLRPDLPLLRQTVIALAPEESSIAPESVGRWADDFKAFCDCWGLVGMATWDLPCPQGPLLPALLPAGSPAWPVQHVQLSLPLHYPISGDQDLLAVILSQQRFLASQIGLDPSVAGLPHYKVYAQIQKIVHYERTIKGRYAQDRRPRRFVTVLIEALAEELHQSVDQVTRLRKFISRCLRGRRADIRRLRPPKQ